VVLGPAAAARRTFFIGGAGVALWSAAAASAASDRCYAQFHSRNEFLEAHINAVLCVEVTLM